MSLIVWRPCPQSNRKPMYLADGYQTTEDTAAARQFPPADAQAFVAGYKQPWHEQSQFLKPEVE